MPKMMGRYFYRREATSEQRIQNVWERESIKQVLARRSLYIFNQDRQGELDNLWVQQPENQATAQLGANWGYYVGLDRIRAHYEKAFPADQKDYSFHMPNGTNIVRIAADGKTAFCLIYSLASEAIDMGAGTRGYDVYDRIWFDMKKEGDDWKIWHVFEGNDFTVENAVNVMGWPAAARKDVEHPVNPTQLEFGTPDYPLEAYNPQFGWYAFPRIPDAHDSYSLDMSCSLEACLKFRAGRLAKKDVKSLYEMMGGKCQ